MINNLFLKQYLFLVFVASVFSEISPNPVSFPAIGGTLIKN